MVGNRVGGRGYLLKTDYSGRVLPHVDRPGIDRESRKKQRRGVDRVILKEFTHCLFCSAD